MKKPIIQQRTAAEQEQLQEKLRELTLHLLEGRSPACIHARKLIFAAGESSEE